MARFWITEKLEFKFALHFQRMHGYLVEIV